MANSSTFTFEETEEALAMNSALELEDASFVTTIYD